MYSPTARKESTGGISFPDSCISRLDIHHIPAAGWLCSGSAYSNGTCCRTPVFNGINNYIKLFTNDPYFIDSIKVTVYFSVLAVIGSMLYSLVRGDAAEPENPARGLLAGGILCAVCPARRGRIYGLVVSIRNEFRSFQLHPLQFGINKVMFLTDSSMIIPSLALISVWLSGNLIVIFLAGLQNVPGYTVRLRTSTAQMPGSGSVT